MKKLLLLVVVAAGLVGCGEEKPKSKLPTDCDGQVITGKSYNIMGSGHFIYKKNGNEFDKAINPKSADLSDKYKYYTISYAIPVVEECTFDKYSYVRATGEYKSKWYDGWVETSILDKGQDLQDPYIRKIDNYITDFKYADHEDDFEETRKGLGNRFYEVDKLRYLAAKAAVDSGKCDYAVASDVDPLNRKSRDNIKFVVECKNKSRINIDEKTIVNGGSIKTDLEKAIPKNIAIDKCNELIKSKARQYGEIDIYSLTGTVFDVNQANGNASVDVYLDVKNKLGVTEKFKARCLFESGSWESEITINTRQ